MLMVCVVTGGTMMPETTTAEVDTIPGEQELNVFFFPINDSTSYQALDKTGL